MSPELKAKIVDAVKSIGFATLAIDQWDHSADSGPELGTEQSIQLTDEIQIVQYVGGSEGAKVCVYYTPKG